MQIENDYEKEVYNGDIGAIDDVDLASSTCWCPPTLRPSTKARVWNIPP
jgi:hypothetical protein